jgi:hypothetical protein
LFGFNQPSGFREYYCLESTNQVVSEKIIVSTQQAKWFQRRLLFGINQPSGFREDYCFDSTGKGVSEKIIVSTQQAKGFQRRLLFGFNMVFMVYGILCHFQ